MVIVELKYDGLGVMDGEVVHHDDLPPFSFSLWVNGKNVSMVLLPAKASVWIRP